MDLIDLSMEFYILVTGYFHPAKDKTSRLNIAKAPFKRIPAIAIQGFGSFRRRLRIPNTTPKAAGTIRIRALISLSMLVVNPERKDSNKVKIQSIASEMRNKRIEVDARFGFIFFSITNNRHNTNSLHAIWGPDFFQSHYIPLLRFTQNSNTV